MKLQIKKIPAIINTQSALQISDAVLKDYFCDNKMG